MMVLFIRLFFYIAILLLTSRANKAIAKQLPLISDGQDLWLAVPHDDKTVKIYHHEKADPPTTLRRVTQLVGTVGPHDLAASQGRLWMGFDHRSLYYLAKEARPIHPSMLYTPSQFEKDLPRGLKLMQLLANDRGVWALVKTTSALALAKIDTPTQSKDAEAITAPPIKDLSHTSKKQLTKIVTQNLLKPSKPQHDLIAPTVRLLRLKRNQWQNCQLPDDWPNNLNVRGVMLHAQATSPTLIIQDTDGHWLIYNKADKQWQCKTYQIKNLKLANATLIAVQGQLVLGQKKTTAQPLSVPSSLKDGKQKEPLSKKLQLAISLIRSSKVIDLGTLAIDSPTTIKAWALATVDQSVTLFAFVGPRKFLISSMNLQGQQLHKTTEMTIEQTGSLATDPDHMLVMVAMTLAMILLFTTWRRNAELGTPTLPNGVVLADLFVRGGAFALDMIPCVVIVLMIFDLNLDALARHWPGTSGGWDKMIPGIVAIGIYIGHTMLFEMFTGQTIGKKILGLRVCSFDGQAPNVWQILARNLLKILDLLIWYVLPFIITVSPMRQRLGDLLAKTIVVSGKPTSDTDDETKEHDSDKTNNKKQDH